MKKNVVPTRGMTAEELRQYLTSQQPRPHWLPEGFSDPIRFICLCFDHGAQDAIGDALPDPQKKLADITAQRFFRGKRMTWLFNVLCEQLSFEHGNTLNGSHNAAELLSSFGFLMEKFAIPYLSKRHGDNVRMRNAIQSVCNSVKVESVKCASMLDGSDGGEVRQLALAVAPDEFRQRLTDLLDLDAATQQTTQAADGGEIARKVADANSHVLAKLGEVHEVVRNIHANTTAAALNTATINDGVSWLVADRKSKIRSNKERGKTNQATGNTEESERAAQDMRTALNRVHDRMKHGSKNVIGECRKVCKEFEPLTTKKNELGKFESYAPLTGVDGKPIKPDTLAKNYRKRFGTKKAKKAKAARTAKPKRRTK